MAPQAHDEARRISSGAALRFTAAAAVSAIVLFAAFRLPFIERHLLEPLTRWQGQLAAATGSGALPVAVTLSCSGADVLALCLAVTFAYPVRWRRRIAGAILGVVWILTLNTARIVVLARTAATPWFAPLHVYVLPALLTLGTVAYVAAWMQWPSGNGPITIRHPAVRVAALAVTLTALLAAIEPRLVSSGTLLAIAVGLARASAACLRALGVPAAIDGNIISTGRASYAVTVECVATPLMPLALAAVAGLPMHARTRIAALIALPPIFAALTIARLMTLALPPIVAGSPLFLTHGFHQFVLALAIVYAAAWIASSGATNRAVSALWRTAGAAAVAIAAAIALGGVYTASLLRILALLPTRAAASVDALTSSTDVQGALVVFPMFQVALLVALACALRPRISGRMTLASLAITGASQIVVLAAVGALVAAGMVVPTLAVRGWSVLLPAVVMSAAVAAPRWSAAGPARGTWIALERVRLPSLPIGAWREAMAVSVVACAMTGVIAFAVLRHPGERIFGSEIVGRHPDPYLVMEQFRTGSVPSPYWQPATDGPGHWLARAVGPAAAFNVMTLATFPLAAACMFALMWSMTRSRIASWTAALAFAFSPFHVAHAAYHVHIAQVQWLPLYLAALWLAIARASIPRLLLLAGAIAGAAASNFYGGLMIAVVTPAAFAGFAWAQPDGSAGGARRTAMLLSAIALAGFIVVRLVAPGAFDAGSPIAFASAHLERYSAAWWSYLLPAAIGPFGAAWARAQWFASGDPGAWLEQQVSLGWAWIALAGVAVAAARASSRVSARLVGALLLIGAVAFACSLPPVWHLGPFTCPGPSALLHAAAPVFRSFARFGAIVQLACAALAGIGASVLLAHRLRVVRVIAVAWLAVGALEYLPWPPPWRDVLPTRGHRWLAGLDAPVRALDCTGERASGIAALWPEGHTASPVADPIGDCAEPELARKLAALGYTHVIIPPGTPLGRWVTQRPLPSGLTGPHRFPGAWVYGVGPSTERLYVAELIGFRPREFDGSRTWRWMGSWGGLTIVNASSAPVEGDLEVELTPVPSARRLRVTVDGVRHGEIDVREARERHAIANLRVRPGRAVIGFEPLEPATIADEVMHNGDRGALSFAVGEWVWRRRTHP